MGILDTIIAKNVEKYIKSMIHLGQSNGDFPNLVFDAARSYAQMNGGVYYEDTPDSIGCNKKFGVKEYWVCFMRFRGRSGTSISLSETVSSVEEDVRVFLASHSLSDLEFRKALNALNRKTDAEIQTERPSWDGDQEKMDYFVKSLMNITLESRIPSTYLIAFMKTSESVGLLLCIVSEIEKSGHTLDQQLSGAKQFVIHMWNRLTNDQKKKIELL